MLGSILMTLFALPATSAGAAQPAVRHATGPSPTIVVWTDQRDDLFSRGDHMSVFYRTDVDGYVTIMRVDTDGRLRILFPRRPGDDNFARGGTAHRVPGRTNEFTLRVEEYPGEGFLFAVVTLDATAPPVVGHSDRWDYVALGVPARLTDDPYAVFAGVLATLMPPDYRAYAYDVLPYSVEEHHGYPRFLCYQCHAYVSPAIWNPYAHSCIRVRIVDRGWPYPFGAVAGTDVIVAEPVGQPRYGFEPRGPEAAKPEPGARRPASTTGRRVVPPAATAPRRAAPATPPRATPTAPGKQGSATRTRRLPAPKVAPATPAAKASSGRPRREQKATASKPRRDGSTHTPVRKRPSGGH